MASISARRRLRRLSVLTEHLAGGDASMSRQRLSTAVRVPAGVQESDATRALSTGGSDLEASQREWHGTPLFDPTFEWGARERQEMDGAGFLVLPGLLTHAARQRLLCALRRVDTLNEADGPARQQRIARLQKRLFEIEAFGALENGAEKQDLKWELWEEQRLGIRRVAAEHDALIAATISHPQMLQLAADALSTPSSTISFDHCALNIRRAGNGGQSWHTHGAAELRDHAGNPWASSTAAPSSLPTMDKLCQIAGLVRIFFYVNGTPSRDGNLKVVRGSHLFWDPNWQADSDDDLVSHWLGGAGGGQRQLHPATGKPLRIEEVVLPAGSVVVMWTHSLHAVNPKPNESQTRWALITAYRNPYARDASGWITRRWSRQPLLGLEMHQKEIAPWVMPPP